MNNANFTADSSLFASAQTNLENALIEFYKCSTFAKDIEFSFPDDFKYKIDINDIVSTIIEVFEYNKVLCDDVDNVKNQLMAISGDWNVAPSSTNNLEDTTWYEDMWNAVTETGESWVSAFKSLISNGNGIIYNIFI